MLLAEAADKGMGKGKTLVCSSWSPQLSAGDQPLLDTEAGSGKRRVDNQRLDPARMKRIYFPLSWTWVVSKVQKGRQC